MGVAGAGRMAGPGYAHQAPIGQQNIEQQLDQAGQLNYDFAMQQQQQQQQQYGHLDQLGPPPAYTDEVDEFGRTPEYYEQFRLKTPVKFENNATHVTQAVPDGYYDQFRLERN